MNDTHRQSPPAFRRIRLLVLSLLFAAGCQRPDGAGPASVSDKQPAATSAVTTTRPVRKSFIYKIEQPGEIQAYAQTPIYSYLSGYVDSVARDIGDRVAEREALAVLSVPELVEQYKEKKAMMAQAEMEVEVAKSLAAAAKKNVEYMDAKVAEALAARPRGEAELRRAESTYQRLKESKAVISAEAIEETRLGTEIARAALKEIDAKMKAAEAGKGESEARHAKAVTDVGAAKAHLEVARAQEGRQAALLEYTRLRAPFAGVVTSRNIDPGWFLQPNASGKAEPVFVIAHIDTVRVFVDAQENDAVLVKDGMPALVSVQALHGEEIKGVVKRSAFSLDSKGRTLRTEIDLKNRDGRLRPGMYVHATILVDRVNTFVIPSSAVVTAGDRTYCVLVEKGKARRTPVRLGVRDGQLIECLKKKTPGQDGAWVDLTGDEQIVTSHPAMLTDDQEVTVNAR